MTSLTSIRTERADARANRLRVLEAARQTFAEHGLSAEVKDIADLAGVGVGTIYRAFGSKTDLLAAVAEQAAQGIESIFEAAESEPDPVTALRGLLTSAAGFTDAYGWLFQLSLGSQFPADARRAPEHRQDFDQRLREVVERGVKNGAYRQDLPLDAVVVMLQGALLSFLRPMARRRTLAAAAFADDVIRLLSPP